MFCSKFKRLFLLTLLSLLFFSTAFADEKCSGGEWLHGYRGVKIAKELREKNGCKTLLYFMADYCALCITLKQELYSKEEFIKRSNNFTKVQLDFRGDWQERRLASKLNITSVPVSIVVGNSEQNNKERKQRVRLHTTEVAGNAKVFSVKDAIKILNNAIEVK